ncbi:MAG: SDR family oxidoreductase [Actinomycetota bacterium]|nr:SDR family oxidoreductase [Actinomycetota bacterium]
MTNSSLLGRRVLIVGASSGIGAALAKAVVADGGDVAISGRRADRLASLVDDMGRGHAVPGDASIPEDAQRVAEEAVAAMGGLDLAVYVAGYGVLQPLTETDPELWGEVFKVNVIGANLAAAATLNYLGRTGLMAFISSRTVEDGNAFFGSYSATKAALDQCIRIWRAEHPDRRFMRVVMGNTYPTEFAEHMRPEFLGAALEAWEAQGIPGGIMDVDDVASALSSSFAVALDHPEIDSSELKFDARPE